MKYWVNLYTWKTWQEYVQAGGKVSGFRESRWRTVQRIKPGDLLLCYMTGISRFFAILEVTGTPYKDDTQIWEETLFPCRLPVRIILALEPGYAVPVVDLRSQLSYFQDLKTPHAWSGHFRGSPTEEKPKDAEIIIEALRQAEQEPNFQEFDRRKLERKVPVFETKTGSVSIPENEDDQPTPIAGEVTGSDTDSVTHEEIQWLLLHIGQQMGLGLWVARNDQSRSFEGQEFQGFSRLRQSLPIQFDAATNRTIELIDVLWLDGNSIVAAFEIEHTTAIYSGLLRMADLITMQPNINIPLFIVAPDERREKVEHEINRPIFSKALKQPLPGICRYIPYSALREKVEQAEIGGFLRYLRPDFLDEIAESVELDEF
jgi:hypothetical protein